MIRVDERTTRLESKMPREPGAGVGRVCELWAKQREQISKKKCLSGSRAQECDQCSAVVGLTLSFLAPAARDVLAARLLRCTSLAFFFLYGAAVDLCLLCYSLVQLLYAAFRRVTTFFFCADQTALRCRKTNTSFCEEPADSTHTHTCALTHRERERERGEPAVLPTKRTHRNR